MPVLPLRQVDGVLMHTLFQTWKGRESMLAWCFGGGGWEMGEEFD